MNAPILCDRVTCPRFDDHHVDQCEQEEALDHAETVVFNALRALACPTGAVDPIDPEDCASVATEAVRAFRATGLVAAPDVRSGSRVCDAAEAMRRGGSEAETCALNGWGIGTRLVGDEGYGPSVIQITAIGESSILARCVSRAGVLVQERETLWTLSARDWQEVAS